VGLEKKVNVQASEISFLRPELNRKVLFISVFYRAGYSL
jgi:hypothetical protein